MNSQTHRFSRARRVFLGCVLGQAVLGGLACHAAEILIVGDTRLKPVAEVVSGIRQAVGTEARLFAWNDVRGDLDKVVGREGARAVIALGKDAIGTALQLPPSVAVIYDLTVVPLESSRPNTTGTYLATPVAEYLDLIRKHLPSLRRVAVVGNREMLRAVGAEGNSQVSAHAAKTAFDLVDTIGRLEGADAVLLLPDVATLTPAAVEQIYLYSFRKKIPLLGISEKHVRQGALLALCFDAVGVGRQIGELATEALDGADMGRIPPSPARKFELYVNTDTAKAMGLAVPAELLKRAKRVYPGAR